MIRTFVLAGAALALAAVPATAAGPRVATVEYKTAGGVEPVISGGTDLNGDLYGAAEVPTRRGERRVEVAAADASGLPVLFNVEQDVDGDDRPDLKAGPFCGKTPQPVKLAAQQVPVQVNILAGTCGSGVSAPTTGTLTVRLS
jgi:hypothetical protein